MATTEQENRETYLTAKSKYADLLAQRGRAEEIAEKSRTETDSLCAQLHDAEDAHRTCEKQHIRGVASADELAAAQSLVGCLREKLAEAERKVGVAQDALAEMRTEISEARDSMGSAFVACCTEIMTGISDALDKNARAKLLEAYAAWAHTGAQYRGRWPDFLAAIFSHPSEAETKSAMTEFRSKHHLE